MEPNRRGSISSYVGNIFTETSNFLFGVSVNIYQENCERSNSRPCRIWVIGKKDAQKKYPSVAAAAEDIGEYPTTVHLIIKNNTHKKWRGEYIVE